jgi:hypothetical protein
MNLPQPETPEWQRPVMFYGKPLTYEHRRHMYFWDGEHVPSVTTIIKRLDKPGLIQWAADTAIEHVRKKAAEFPEGFRFGTLENICQEARQAHRVKKEAAADIGNVLHDIAECVQEGREPDPGMVAKLPVEDQLIASNCALSLKEWMAAQRFGSADLERKVFSRDLRYAGRCDRFGVINNHLAVLDFKSGGEKIYPETWLQMSAYEVALQEELGFNEPVWHYAIHLNKKTGKCTPHVRGPQHTDAAKEAWRRLVDFDRWMRQVPTEAQMRKVA